MKRKTFVETEKFRKMENASKEIRRQYEEGTALTIPTYDWKYKGHFAKDLKKYRELLNMTQKEFAEEYFTTLRSIRSWEQGKRTPKNAGRFIYPTWGSIQEIEEEEELSSSSTGTSQS